MAKRIIKIAVDVVMFILFLLLMEEHLITDGIHEWLGITLFLLFVVHLLLNIKWFSKICKGKYTAYRIVLLITDLFLAAAMICCMISSVFVSGSIFAGLNLKGKEVGRSLHLVATAWAFLAMTIHLGLHWNIALGMIKKISLPERISIVLKWGFRILVVGIGFYGIVVFVHRKFYEELFFITAYKGYDMSVSAFAYLLQTCAVAVTFIALTYYIKAACFLLKKEKRNEKKN